MPLSTENLNDVALVLKELDKRKHIKWSDNSCKAHADDNDIKMEFLTSLFSPLYSWIVHKLL